MATNAMDTGADLERQRKEGMARAGQFRKEWTGRTANNNPQSVGVLAKADANRRAQTYLTKVASNPDTATVGDLTRAKSLKTYPDAAIPAGALKKEAPPVVGNTAGTGGGNLVLRPEF